MSEHTFEVGQRVRVKLNSIGASPVAGKEGTLVYVDYPMMVKVRMDDDGVVWSLGGEEVEPAEATVRRIREGEVSDIPMGLTPDEEAAFERWANTPPAITSNEAREDMAQGYARVIEEALTHIENLLDVADGWVTDDYPDDIEMIARARKFWNEMNTPGKHDDADDPRYPY